MGATALAAVALLTFGAPALAEEAGGLAGRVAERTRVRSGSAGCGGLEQVTLETLRVSMRVRRRHYRVGDVARFEIRVWRQLPQNPAGTGVYYDSPYMEPAPDIPVGTGVRIGDAFLYGFSITDERGRAVVKVRLERYTPKGNATATTFASKNQADTPCARVDEVGYTALPRAFMVHR